MNVAPLALFDVVTPEAPSQGASAPLPFAALLQAATTVSATPAAAAPEVVIPVAPVQAALAPEAVADSSVATEVASLATGAPPVSPMDDPLAPALPTRRLQPQTLPARVAAIAGTPSPRRVAVTDADLPAALVADADANVDADDKPAAPEKRRAETDAPLAVAVIAVQPHTPNRSALPQALALSTVPVGQPVEAGAVQSEAAVQSRRQSHELRLAQNGPDVAAVSEPMSPLVMSAAMPMPLPVTPAAPATPIVSQLPIAVTADEAHVEVPTTELPTQRKAADPVAVSATQNPTAAAALAPSAGRTALMPPRETAAHTVVQAVPLRLKEAVAQTLPPQRDEPVAQRRMPPRPVPQQVADIAAAPPALQQPDTPETVAALPRAAAAPAVREPTQVETEALGNVTIALDRRDAALHVHFTVDRASTAHALLDSARLLDCALQAGGTRLDQLSVDVRGGDVRSGAPTGADARAPASHSDGGGQRPPTRDPRTQDTPLPFQPAPSPRHAQTSAHDRFA